MENSAYLEQANAQRVNHQNFAKKTHPCDKKNMVPRAVLMKSGLVSVNTTRQVNDGHSKTTVNAARPMSYFSKIAHSTIKRPVHKNTTFKNSNINQKVNTARDKKFNTARPKAVVNDVKGNNFNIVKASACWVWKSKTKVLDHVSKHNSASITLKKFDYVDAQGRSKLRRDRWRICCFWREPQRRENHRKRLGHLNFKTMNKLVKGLPNFLKMIKPVLLVKRESSIEPLVKAVNTACYVQNRVLVLKPHNKTPYELFHGRTPTLSFMRQFGCPVTILNTIDHLGKFNGKADEGFYVGHSLKSKAFRVFNSRTRIVEENLHIRFSENTPNVVGSRPDFLFDIDALTRTMNYEPIFAGTQSNGFAGTKASDNAGQTRRDTEPIKNYILLPLWTADPPFFQNPKSSQDDRFKPSIDDEKKVDEDPRKDSECNDQEKEDNVNNTNNVNAASTNEVNVVGGKTSIELPFDPNMPALEDYSIFDYSSNDKDDGAEADMNNLDTTIQVSPILTTRIHKDHPLDQVIGDLQSATQTRKMSKNLEEHGFVSTIQQRTNHKDLSNLLVLLAFNTKESKSNSCSEDPSWIRRLCRKSFYNSNNEFQRGKIDKTLFIKRYKGDILLVQVYVDDIIFGSTKKELCLAFEKLMHEKFQMSSIGELTFFLGLQVKQKKDGIFISQDKYVDEILKKFGFTEVKTTSTPMETQKPLLKDEDGEEVDVHMYRSMIGSLMYLTSSRPDIMFAVCACARYQVNPKVSHLHAVKRIFRYLKGQPKLGLWYPKDSPFDLVAYTDSDYAGASLDRKSTTGATLKFADSHNMVAFLSKPAESEGFEQIVDFLNAHPIRYALTVNPTIYVSCIEQFWSSVVAKTINGEVQLHALVDGKRIVITETSVRRSLRLADAEGIDCFSNSTIFENLALMGYEKISEKLTFYKAFFSPQWKFLIHTILQCLSPKTTAWNEFSSTMASAIICLATNQKFNFSKLIFDSMVRNLDNLSGKFLMYPRELTRMDTEIPQSSGPTKHVAVKAVHKERGDSLVPRNYGGTTAQTRFENVSTQSYDPLLARGNTLQSDEDSLKLKELCTNLQQRVLDLEKTKTTQAEEIVGAIARVESSGGEESLGEDASKQGRIDAIDADNDITLVSVYDVNISAGKEEVVEVINTAKLIIDAAQVSVAGDKVSTANAAITVSVATTTTTTTVEEITLAQALADLKNTKPKAKGIAFRESGESTTTTTTPIPSNIQVKGKEKMIEPEPMKKLSKKDQLKLDEEIALKLQAEIDEEERIARAKEENIDEANIAWDDIQAKVDANYQLAERLQAEEQEHFTIEQKATLLEAQNLKSKAFNFIKELFEKALKRVDDIQETAKVDNDQEAAKIKELMKIVSDEEEVAIDAIPLAVKPPSIVDWKIHTEGKKSYYQIIRADGKCQMYLVNKAREGYKSVLWGDLKIYMLVEKKYHLTPATITDMLNKKLQCDHFSETAYQLLKSMTKQLFGVTTALIDVNATQSKLVLLKEFQ
ncbi:putative ribonuclease H-like domain-containing protein [Tanacetum coccineum]